MWVPSRAPKFLYKLSIAADMLNCKHNHNNPYQLAVSRGILICCSGMSGYGLASSNVLSTRPAQILMEYIALLASGYVVVGDSRSLYRMIDTKQLGATERIVWSGGGGRVSTTFYPKTQGHKWLCYIFVIYLLHTQFVYRVFPQLLLYRLAWYVDSYSQ